MGQIKIWTDEHNLKAGFFDENNVLEDEIPIEDCNHKIPYKLKKELEGAYDEKVRYGFMKIRPGNSNLEFNGEIKDEINGDRIIEFCEKCGRAGAGIHKMRGIGDNRHPICRYCKEKTMRHACLNSMDLEADN